MYFSEYNSVKPSNKYDLKITYDQLEELITKLKKTIETLRSSWSREINKNIEQINNSWAGKDCNAYTAKLSQMNGRVQKTIQALELLCNTYEKTKEMILTNQNATNATINKLQ